MKEITVTLTLEPTMRNLSLIAELCGDAPVLTQTSVLTDVKEQKTPVVETPATKTPVVEAKVYTAADVKAVCLKLSKEGRQADLKAAFAKFGAKKLSEIGADDYPALMKELGHE